MKPILLPILACALLCGCNTVPKTTIAFDPTGKAVAIASPKDVEMKNLNVAVSGTNFTVKVEEYKSKINAEVVRAVAQANIAQAKMALQAAELALKALTVAP